MSPVVEAVDLVKRYGTLEAVSSVSFTVEKGRFYGLLGPNGAGKSTTMRMIYQVTPPTSGKLEVFGLPSGVQARAIIDVYSYYFTLFLTPSFLFSDIFFPVADRFPPALVAVAEVTPLYRSVQLLRGIVMGDMSGAWLDVIYLLLVGGALAVFAIWQMRRKVVR